MAMGDAWRNDVLSEVSLQTLGSSSRDVLCECAQVLKDRRGRIISIHVHASSGIYLCT